EIMLFLLCTIRERKESMKWKNNPNARRASTSQGTKDKSKLRCYDCDPTALPNQYIQPPHERFDSSNEEPNQDSIPVIDMSNWDDPNVAKDICDAARKWGFFQIVNHGVPYHVLDDVKDATRKFFALPAEEKLKYSKEKSVTNSIRFGTSFTPEAEKALEWKDYLSLFFVSDDEFATLWPSVCR
ncbi:feruloyl CoA ortho-hydroxylase 1-like protein, partial [Tanacetum coccineum]